MEAAQGRVQAEEAAETPHAARTADRPGHKPGAPARKVSVAVWHSGGQTIQRAAQDDDHEALVGRRVGEGEGGSAKRPSGGQAQSRAAGHGQHRQRLWNSGEAKSSVKASRRDPARWTSVAVSVLRKGPSAASASCTGSCLPTWPAKP
jgi:hypothetical protein